MEILNALDTSPRATVQDATGPDHDSLRAGQLIQWIGEARGPVHYYSEKSGPVISLYFDVSSDWSQYILLRSDVHHDSIHCQRDLEARHLKLAKERNALILDAGDLYDAMQGKFDPRRAYSEIRPEYLAGNKYYDNILADLESAYAPYADRMVMLGKGNHETSVIANAGTDLTERLADRLNANHGGQIHVGSYGGWVRLVFLRAGRFMTTLKIKYYHGFGGDAPATRGVLHVNRQAVYQPDADIVWNGHNHHSYAVPIKRERLTTRGRQYFDLQWHLRTPGYANTYGTGEGGWAVEKGMPPKPLGCAFLHLAYHDHRIELTPEAKVE